MISRTSGSWSWVCIPEQLYVGWVRKEPLLFWGHPVCVAGIAPQLPTVGEEGDL